MVTTAAVPERPRAGEGLRDALLVLLTFALAMAAAWGLKTFIEQRTITFTAADGSFTLDYPTGWIAARAASGVFLDVSDPQSSESARARFTVQAEPAAADGSLREAAGLISLRRSEALREYRELSSQATTVSGQPAIAVTYAYVADPPAGAGPATLPIVVQATDVLLLGRGQVYIFTGASEAAAADYNSPVFQRILASIRVRSTP